MRLNSKEPLLLAAPSRDLLFEQLRSGLIVETCADLLLVAIELRRVAHAGDQLLRLPGLGDILIDASFIDAGDDVFGLGIAGDDDANRIGPGDACALQEIDADSPAMRDRRE